MPLVKTKKAKLDVEPPALTSLLVIIAFASVNAVFYTPGMPAIQEAFGVSSSDAKMTMTLFLLGYAFGQLIYGPLANRFGRKHALYIGIGVALIGNVLCALSGPIGLFTLLLIGRLVTAVGSAAGLAMAFTIISDYYYAADARKIIAYLTIGFAAAPGISVAVGGGIVDWLGWGSAFYVMVLYCLLVAGLAYGLPETGINLHPHATKALVIMRRYLHVFRDGCLLRYSLIAGLCTSMIYVFSTAAPFIAIGRFKMGEWEYGLFFLIPSAALMGAGVLAGKISHRLPARQIMLFGILIALTGSLALTCLFYAKVANPYSFFFTVAFAFIGCPLIYSNATALATSETDDKSHAASAMSFINMGTAVLGVLLLGLIPARAGSLLPYLLVGASVSIGVLFASIKSRDTLQR